MATSPLGTRLRDAREGRGWSRAVLAGESGTSEPAIARTELYGNSPRLATLVAWADALGVSVSDLVDHQPPVCTCQEPDLDGLGECQTCHRKPADLLRPPAEAS